MDSSSNLYFRKKFDTFPKLFDNLIKILIFFLKFDTLWKFKFCKMSSKFIFLSKFDTFDKFDTFEIFDTYNIKIDIFFSNLIHFGKVDIFEKWIKFDIFAQM